MASVTTHLFSYRYAGREWSLELPGESATDAKERLRAMALAKYDGELVANVPAFASPLAKVVVWIRNAVFGKIR